jgi:hypothetical protein
MVKNMFEGEDVFLARKRENESAQDQ